ncbi:MAG: NAD(P)H-hydrate dehydratase [Candidatus Solibacter usitatus]|nr:NAD(P)H-hydrate dehydratase [Candidatus Solibacter usitatus]
MKVLTAAQMREVDRRTIERGTPGLALMENAGQNVVAFIEEKFTPLGAQHVVVFCGKGNNGGDGLVAARELLVRGKLRALDVVLVAAPEEMTGDAAANYRKFVASGGRVHREVTPAMRDATVIVDALLGTGLKGPAGGAMLQAIRQINTEFRSARVVAVDIPSGLASDCGRALGESVRADFTVTFTAPKVGLVLAPNCDQVGELRVCSVGSPPELFESDPEIWLSLIQPRLFAALLAPRAKGANKGSFGHVLVVGGSCGKTGAPAMTAMAALRAGAGLVTVASAAENLSVIAGHAPEIMTAPLAGNLAAIASGKTVLAVGPGLGTSDENIAMVRTTFAESKLPMVVDADGLNALAGAKWAVATGKLRVLTPHPGEMARLCGKSIAEIQEDRAAIARGFALDKQVCLVLKGQRTFIAFPDGRVWINPTGSPAMAKGGTGDILTGLIAGMLAQFPPLAEQAVAAAVYLHGLAGELGAAQLGEKSLIATDLLRYLPAALEECAKFPDRL